MLFLRESRAVWAFDFTLKTLVFIEVNVVPGPHAPPPPRGTGDPSDQPLPTVVLSQAIYP